MRKFSWYTFKGKDEHGRYVGNLVYGVGGIAPFRKCYDNYRPDMKGGHHHRRNYCICSVCGKWFRRNKGRHYDYSDGTYHFCCGPCDEQAQFEADLEADVGGGFCPRYWDDEGDAEWRKNEIF